MGRRPEPDEIGNLIGIYLNLMKIFVAFTANEQISFICLPSKDLSLMDVIPLSIEESANTGVINRTFV